MTRHLRGPAFLATLALAGCLTGCTGGVLDPKGPIAAAEKLILLNSLAIMLLIVVPVVLLTAGFAWWFRAGNTKARYLPDFTYSGQLEALVWAIPALVVLFLGGIAWYGSHDLDPWKRIEGSSEAAQEKTLEVEVVSLDWKWLFIYPEEGIASVNQLTIPANTPVHFRLTSATVMNSFFIPQLGSQIYTMAGMTSQLSLLAESPGTYRGFSAQYSGEGFSDMHFNVDAVPAAAFEAWVAKTKAGDEALDTTRLKTLLEPGVEKAPLHFSKAEAGLFDHLLMQTLQAPPREPPLPAPSHQAHHEHPSSP